MCLCVFISLFTLSDSLSITVDSTSCCLSQHLSVSLFLSVSPCTSLVLSLTLSTSLFSLPLSIQVRVHYVKLALCNAASIDWCRSTTHDNTPRAYQGSWSH